MALSSGMKAPDFKTKDQDGKEVSLSTFKGKKVVLYFYPKDMTAGCTAEACSLRDNYTRLQKAGYEIVGVSKDDEKSHRKFIEKEKLPFRLLADTDLSVHKKYGTWIEKSMYGRKYMGTARVTFLINEQGLIDEVIGKVDTKDHAAQILGGGSVKTASTSTRKFAILKKAKPVRKVAKPKGAKQKK